MSIGPHSARPAPADANRLQVLKLTGLLDSEAERGFDRLTRLAARLLNAPVALVSLVDDHRQFFKSALGLAEPWASRRETPLSHSFCQHVTRERQALVVSDARQHPMLRDNRAIPELGAIAYAGIPLVVSDEAIGAFCVIDDKPREWTPERIEILEDLAASVVSEIELRLALRSAREARAVTDAIVESMGDGCIAIDPGRKFLIVNQAARRVFAEGAEVGKLVPKDWSGLHNSRRPDGSRMPSEEGALGRALQGHETNNLMFTLQKTGLEQPVWVEVSGRPVRAPDGKVIAAVAVYRDVTEKKKQADFHAALMRNIPQGAVGLFDRNLRLLTIDGSLLRAVNIPPAAIQGRTVRELGPLAPDSAALDRIDDAFRRALAGDSVNIDFQYGPRIVELHVAPAPDGWGQIAAGIMLAVDVTAQRQLALDLRRSEQIHRAIVRHLPRGAVLMVDRDLRYVSADGPLLPELLRHRELDGLVGRLAAEVAAPEGREALLEQYRLALGGQSVESEIEREGRFFDLSIVPIYDGAEISHALVSTYDITQRRREAMELRQTRDSLAREQMLLETTLAHVEDGVALIGRDSRILLANRAFSAMWGARPEDVVGLSREGFIQCVEPLLAEPEGLGAALAAQPQHVSQEFVFARPRRRILARSWTNVPLVGGDGILVTWHDVTAERDLQREREELLLIDALTGIPNRRAADRALLVEHQRMVRAGTPMSVALLDIDHFKRVNDVYGHPIGDQVLRFVAKALAGQGRVTDFVARWGGEEFVAVLNVPLPNALVFCERARRRVEALKCDPVERITISIGVAQVTAGELPIDAMARADKQLYEAKSAGRNRVRPAADHVAVARPSDADDA